MRGEGSEGTGQAGLSEGACVHRVVSVSGLCTPSLSANGTIERVSLMQRPPASTGLTTTGAATLGANWRQTQTSSFQNVWCFLRRTRRNSRAHVSSVGTMVGTHVHHIQQPGTVLSLSAVVRLPLLMRRLFRLTARVSLTTDPRTDPSTPAVLLSSANSVCYSQVISTQSCNI